LCRVGFLVCDHLNFVYFFFDLEYYLKPLIGRRAYMMYQLAPLSVSFSYFQLSIVDIHTQQKITTIKSPW